MNWTELRFDHDTLPLKKQAGGKGLQKKSGMAAAMAVGWDIFGSQAQRTN
ncbi:MAG: hypothetical protein KKC76_00665 [Proteobacteria bacterium]|nr:hypothetical protein [Pseudomonadota bacterium]MBU4297045.1 hypothetical protein [Pseudomonadota bacterium]MCG2749926.1 hypothetical protein [Desulfobulbaceae bacterium]